MRCLVCADQETPDQFWQCFKRTGLSHRDALALLGSHPFAAAWQDPADAEARHGERPLQFSNTFYKCASSVPHLVVGCRLMCHALR